MTRWAWDLRRSDGDAHSQTNSHQKLGGRAEALGANGGLHKLRVGWLRRQWRKAGVLVRAYGLGGG